VQPASTKTFQKKSGNITHLPRRGQQCVMARDEHVKIASERKDALRHREQNAKTEQRRSCPKLINLQQYNP